MKKYKLCRDCLEVFDRKHEVCPSCGGTRLEENIFVDMDKEEEGKKYHAGGEVMDVIACDYCPQCYGSADWCPFLDD